MQMQQMSQPMPFLGQPSMPGYAAFMQPAWNSQATDFERQRQAMIQQFMAPQVAWEMERQRIANEFHAANRQWEQNRLASVYAWHAANGSLNQLGA